MKTLGFVTSVTNFNSPWHFSRGPEGKLEILASVVSALDMT
jgi:hypothetical protein